MIQEKYYSTLTETLHDKRSEAQKAEDKYVQDYFDDLDRRAANKRRWLKHVTESNEFSSRRIHID